MLQQMGWKEKGLGKDEEGRTEHVKVQRKRDCLGMELIFTTCKYSLHYTYTVSCNCSISFSVRARVNVISGSGSG